MTNIPENTEKKQTTQWQKGQSGNPAGKPKGARHKATIAAQTLLDGEAEALTRKAVESALSGDMTALRLCLERIVPPCKDSTISIELPTIKTPTDIIAVQNVIIDAVATGDVTPSQGTALMDIVAATAKAIELHNLDARLTQLEQHMKGK